MLLARKSRQAKPLSSFSFTSLRFLSARITRFSLSFPIKSLLRNERHDKKKSWSPFLHFSRITGSPCSNALHWRRHRFFTTSEQIGQLEDDYRDYPQERFYFEPDTPLLRIINQVLSMPLGSIHPLDLHYTCTYLLKDCCTETASSRGTELATKLLNKMLQEKRHLNKIVVEDGRKLPIVIRDHAFHMIMFGWAKLSGRISRGPGKILELLELMGTEDEYDQSIHLQVAPKNTDEYAQVFETTSEQLLSCQPTTHSYNIFFLSCKYALSADAARKAEHVLLEVMPNLADKGWKHTKPNTRSYALVVLAHAKSQSPDSGVCAERILRKMQERHIEEKLLYQEVYGEEYDIEDPYRNKKKIVTPDVQAYTAVILAHGSTNYGAERAEALLMEMIEIGMVPDAIAFTTTIQAWANASAPGGRNHIKKGIVDRISAAERAQNLLNFMKSLALDWEQAHGAESEENKLLPLTPERKDAKGTEDDFETYVYYDEKEEPRRSEQTIGNPFLPDVITYNIVLNAWARSDTSVSAPRAEKLLCEMLEDVSDSVINDDDKTGKAQLKIEVKPNAASFYAVMNAWARFDRYNPNAAQKAEDLLALMYDAHRSGRFGDSIKPDAVAYSIVINAWARSGGDTNGKERRLGVSGKEENHKVMHARRVLDIMLSKFQAGDDGMRPNALAFTSVLNAAAHSYPFRVDKNLPAAGSVSSSVKKKFYTDPLDIAMRTYTELKDDPYDLKISPDHLTYATMLKVISVHMDPTSEKRRDLVETLFNAACDAGQVSFSVITALREACPSVDMLERLLMGSRELKSVDELPKKWTRYVKGDLRIRKIDVRGVDRRFEVKGNRKRTSER